MRGIWKRGKRKRGKRKRGKREQRQVKFVHTHTVDPK
jgi:hypothetical protein